VEIVGEKAELHSEQIRQTLMTERAHHPPTTLTLLEEEEVEVEAGEVEEVEVQTHPGTLEAHPIQKDLQAAHHLRTLVHPLVVIANRNIHDTHVMVEMGDEMANWWILRTWMAFLDNVPHRKALMI
jgi:6,7-dimethyl-8-ribityllumazine synthase